MIEKIINIKKNDKHEIYKFDSLNFTKFNILVGKNGSGKSSTIRGIEGWDLNRRNKIIGNGHASIICENLNVILDSETQILCYSSRENNGKYRGYFEDDTITDIHCLFSSEGQSNKISFVSFMMKIRDMFRSNNNLNICILIDELESGLSPNVIREIIKGLCTISAIEDNLQIIMSTNNWETLNSIKNIDCINIINVEIGEKIKCPQTYDEFYKIYE